MKNYHPAALLASALLIVSCQREPKEDLTHLLTRDSIQFFDVYTEKDGYTHPVNSFSFDAKGKNELYYIDTKTGERHVAPYFNEPFATGFTNNWKVKNDSTIMLFGTLHFEVERRTDDSLYITDGQSKSLMVRLQSIPKVNEASLRRKDSLYEALRRQPNPKKK